ncbi:MAG: hypothetical protein JW828_06340 [Sedimentisphaerales bacterium]|nr:hypothetical protein [Sedimentisphaerales bacterium]
MKSIMWISAVLSVTAVFGYADCPLDHLLIGCNPDGVWGTKDDHTLFLDCSQKYRHSDPEHSGDPTWKYWHYPMYYNARYQRYQIGEPGFDVFGPEDPNHMLQGLAGVDYHILIECVSISPGLIARDPAGRQLDEPGDTIDHSMLSESHLHVQYRWPLSGDEFDPNSLCWITYRLHDTLADDQLYASSEEVTILFFNDPPPGDLIVNHSVDEWDLSRFLRFWLFDEGGRNNDYYERADINRDSRVNLLDFSMLAQNWRYSPPRP